MHEETIQNALYGYLLAKGHEYIIPNIYIGYEESDLIGVTRAGYIYEYEIKISRADYKADFKKSKHGVMKNGLRNRWRTCFFFVTPVGLIKPGEIPDYAGHIEVTKNGTCIDKKRAKRFKANKLRDYQKEQISKGLMLRFWRMRARVIETAQLKLF